jgi:transposase-like protein
MAKRKKFTEKAKVKLLKAFQTSRLTAREFCKQQGVAASSFSFWRKGLTPKLKIEPTEKVIARKQTTVGQHLDFISVALIEAKPTGSVTKETALIEPAGAAAFEMLLPSGSMIRFGVNCPPSFVTAAFAAIAVQ